MPDPINGVLMAGLPILVFVYSIGSALALRPRTGTLEWIPACDRPAPLLLGHPCPAEKMDIITVTGVCVLTVLLRLFGTMRPLSAAFSLPPADLTLLVLKQLAAPLITVALSCLLMKRMFGRSISAALAAILIGADLVPDPVTLAFSAASLYFLIRYLTVPEEAGVRQTLIPLVCGFVLLAAGCYFDPALLLMLPAAIALCVAGCVDRFIMAGKLWLASCLTAGLLSVTLVWILIWIPDGIAEGYTFPALLLEGGYYWMVLQRLGSGFTALYGWKPPGLPNDWPLLLAALPALIAAVAWVIKLRSRRSIVLLIWFGMQLLTMTLLGSHALSPGCALCLCQVWTKLEENRFLWLACAGAGILFVLLLIPYIPIL